MAEKNIKTRIVHKHDVQSNWEKATGFTPMKGEIIIYDIDNNYSYERIKIGDGVQNVNALPFVDDAPKTELLAQIGDVDDKVYAVSTLVGDTAVSTQISEAIEQLPQTDWSQNDETAADYVKNRTHYEEIADTVIFSNNALTIDSTWCVENQLSTMLTEGTTYTVIWNGETYECLARNDGYNDIYIGNQSLSDDWEFAEAIESNEPFFIATYAPDLWSTIRVSAEGTYTVSVSGLTLVVHKIDEKYLPDTAAKKDDIVCSDWAINNKDSLSYINHRTHYAEMDERTVTHLSSLELANNGYYKVNKYFTGTAFSPLTTFEISDPLAFYIAEIDGKTYTSFSVGNIYSNPGSDHQWLNIYDTQGNVVFQIRCLSSGNNSYYLYNYTGGVVQKFNLTQFTPTSFNTIDERFIPDTIARTADIPAIDTTLAVEGAAADAKATGDAIGAVSALVGDTSVSEQITTAIDEATADDFGIYVQDTEPTDAVAGDIWIDTANDPTYTPPTIPEVTEADNGKVLMVVNGTYQLATVNLSVDANGVLSM